MYDLALEDTSIQIESDRLRRLIRKAWDDAKDAEDGHALFDIVEKLANEARSAELTGRNTIVKITADGRAIDGIHPMAVNATGLRLTLEARVADTEAIEAVSRAKEVRIDLTFAAAADGAWVTIDYIGSLLSVDVPGRVEHVLLTFDATRI